jgi:hypothetical protein
MPAPSISRRPPWETNDELRSVEPRVAGAAGRTGVCHGGWIGALGVTAGPPTRSATRSAVDRVGPPLAPQPMGSQALHVLDHPLTPCTS